LFANQLKAMGGGFGFGYGCHAMSSQWYGASFPGCQRPGGTLVLGANGRASSALRVPLTHGSVPLSRADLRGRGGCCQGPLDASVRYSGQFGYYQPGTSRRGPLGVGDAPIRYGGAHQAK